jgi:anti-anti-sigma factor
MISSQIDNKTLFMNVKGALTVDIFHEFETAYAKKDVDHIVIDLSQCDHIDSGGLGMLLQMRERMGNQPDKITLKNLSEDLMQVFEVVKFEQLFKMA